MNIKTNNDYHEYNPHSIFAMGGQPSLSVTTSSLKTCTQLHDAWNTIIWPHPDYNEYLLSRALSVRETRRGNQIHRD